jgi:hypothetical protein
LVRLPRVVLPSLGIELGMFARSTVADAGMNSYDRRA